MNTPSEELLKIRKIRTTQNMSFKPSRYLRNTFVDEYGETKDVKIRNYQAQGVMNLLQVERMIEADDTGLGKTLILLNTIGFIWMKEPNYIPIIITTKSSLFQWESEVKKFMKDIETITVSGAPHERHSLYEEFFWRHNSEKKRLLLMTYDVVVRDMSTSVIRDRSVKPNSKLKSSLALLKKERKNLSDLFDEGSKVYEKWFGDRIFDVCEFARDKLVARDAGNEIPNHPLWSNNDQVVFDTYCKYRSDLKAKDNEILSLNNEIAPPKQVSGLLSYVEDLKSDHPESNFMLIMDEMHKLKNHKSQFHDQVKLLSLECKRLYGMTATPVKNRLMEFFSLFRIVKPDLFPKITQFQNAYCVMKMQPIGGGRQVPVVVGYRNLDDFVSKIEPYYLSRKKYEVAKELPELISREVECELSEIQEELYDMAESGLLSKSEDPDSNSSDVLSSLTMCQQAADAPDLISDEEGNPFKGPSAKVDALLELLEGEASDQKVIVFSRFERMISLVDVALKKAKINCLRITGKESDAKIREKHKNTFQDMNSGVNVILITTAGSESINLHSAEHIILLDLPYSWGDYIQLIGRAVRIGSLNKIVTAHHFLGKKRTGKNTIDHHVLKLLRSKKKLADKVAGESLKSGLSFTDSGNAPNDILQMIKADHDNLKPKKDVKQLAKQTDNTKSETKMIELDLSDI